MTGGGNSSKSAGLGLYRGSEHGPEEKRVSCAGMWIPGRTQSRLLLGSVLRKCFVGEFNAAKIL